MYDPELEYLCKRMIEGGVNNNKKGKLPSSIFLNMFRISSISFIYEKTLSFFVDVCSSVECPSPEKIPVQVLSLLLEDIGIKFNAEFSHIIEQLIQENERSFQNSFQTRDEIDASFRMRTKAFDTVGIDSEDSLVARLERRKRKSEAQLLSSKYVYDFLFPFVISELLQNSADSLNQQEMDDNADCSELNSLMKCLSLSRLL
jgi:hypothetical protein